jgi:hypothetical protein
MALAMPTTGNIGLLLCLPPKAGDKEEKISGRRSYGTAEAVPFRNTDFPAASLRLQLLYVDTAWKEPGRLPQALLHF